MLIWFRNFFYSLLSKINELFLIFLWIKILMCLKLVKFGLIMQSKMEGFLCLNLTLSKGIYHFFGWFFRSFTIKCLLFSEVADLNAFGGAFPTSISGLPFHPPCVEQINCVNTENYENTCTVMFIMATQTVSIFISFHLISSYPLNTITFAAY